MSPVGLFKRQSLNRTYIENISSNPTVYWTLQVKFIAITQNSDDWYVRSEIEAEVIMNEVPESMTLSSFLSSGHIAK